MPRKLVDLLICLIALVFVSVAAVRPVVAQPAPQVVTLWHNLNGPGQNALNWIIRRYQAAHPDVQIDARYVDSDLQAAYLTAFRAQRSPDMILGLSSWTNQLADLNAIISLDARMSDAVTANTYPAAWQSIRYRGQTYGIPNSAECVALYYNSRLVAKPASSFDALVGQIQGKTPAALSIAYDFYTTAGMYFGLGGRFTDKNNQLALDANVLLNYLTMLRQMYAANPLTPLLPGGVPVTTDVSFRLGQSAYLIDGSWKLADLNRYLNVPLRVAILPDLSTGHPWKPLVNTKAFFIGANSDRQDAAFDFATYALTSNPQTVIAALGGEPPVNLKARVDDSRLAAFTKQCAAGAAVSPDPGLSTFWRVLDQAAFAVTVNGQPVDTTVTTAIKQAALAMATATPQP